MNRGNREKWMTECKSIFTNMYDYLTSEEDIHFVASAFLDAILFFKLCNAQRVLLRLSKGLG